MDSSGGGWIRMGCLCLVPAGRASLPYIWGLLRTPTNCPLQHWEKTLGKYIENTQEKHWKNIGPACHISGSGEDTNQLSGRLFLPADLVQKYTLNLLATKGLLVGFCNKTAVFSEFLWTILVQVIRPCQQRSK